MLVLVGIVALVVLGVVVWSSCRPEGRPMDAKGKGVLVTGAASGIGLATAKLLCQKGCHVYATDVSEEALRRSFAEELAGGGAGRVTAVKMDVTSDEDVRRARQLIEANGDLFAVVNNAGVGCSNSHGLPQGVDELDVDSRHGRLIWDVNVFGALRVTRHFADVLPSDGAVVAVASVAGIVAPPFSGYYPATKFALVACMDALRRENLATGRRVVTVCPGFTDTPMLAGLGQQLDVDAATTRHHALFSSPLVAARRAAVRRTAQSPDAVARAIVERAVLAQRPQPLLVVDSPSNRVVWWLVTVLPRRWADALLMRHC